MLKVTNKLLAIILSFAMVLTGFTFLGGAVAVNADDGDKPSNVMMYRGDEVEEFQPASGGTFKWEAMNADWSMYDPLIDMVDAGDFQLQKKRVSDSEWADETGISLTVTAPESGDEDMVTITAAIPENTEDYDISWRVIYKHSEVSLQIEEGQSIHITQLKPEAPPVVKPELGMITIDAASGSAENQPAAGGTYAWFIIAKDEADLEEAGLTGDDFIMQVKSGDGDWATSPEASAEFEIGTNPDEGVVTATVPDNGEETEKQWRFFYEGGGAVCPAITQAAYVPAPALTDTDDLSVINVTDCSHYGVQTLSWSAEEYASDKIPPIYIAHVDTNANILIKENGFTAGSDHNYVPTGMGYSGVDYTLDTPYMVSCTSGGVTCNLALGEADDYDDPGIAFVVDDWKTEGGPLEGRDIPEADLLAAKLAACADDPSEVEASVFWVKDTVKEGRDGVSDYILVTILDYDAAGTVEHDWSTEPEWAWTEGDADEWTATATFVCKNQPLHKQAVDAAITSEEKDGKTVYTATATFNENTYTDVKEVEHAAPPAEPAVEAAAAKIDSLPGADKVTAADKAAIEAARAAYDALTDEQKAQVGEDVLRKLTEAEAALKKIEDKTAADAVKALIDALPASGSITTADQASIEAARAAYDALTDEQKALISATIFKKLTNSETSLDKAVKAAKAEAKAKKVRTVKVNTKVVTAKAIDKAVKKAGGSNKYVTRIVLGKKVKKISPKAFAKYKKVTTLEVRTKKLTKKKVKNALKGSKVKTIKVKVAKKAKTNKKYLKKYKKIFTKKNAGRKVKVKAIK